MTRYSRITTNPTFLSGQACIRGLPITVSEVIQQVVSGKALEDVLALYPELEPEDIYEAQAYAVGDLLHSINTWRFQALKSINRAEEYEHLLLDDDLNERYTLSNAQKRRFAQDLLEETEHIEDAWYYLREWANVNYVPKLLWQPRQLSEIQERVAKHNESRSQVEIDWHIPDDLPAIRSNTFLADALYQLATDTTTLPAAKAEVDVWRTETGVQVSVKRTVPMGKAVEMDDLLRSGSPLAMAAIIVYQHGDELLIEQSGGVLSFLFELPVWAE